MAMFDLRPTSGLPVSGSLAARSVCCMVLPRLWFNATISFTNAYGIAEAQRSSYQHFGGPKALYRVVV